jgi:C-terminal processing protease CtpA/Prc
VDGVAYRVAGSVPVAVLIDRGTASSAEAVAVGFRGKLHTRFFGEHTLGFSTNDNNYVLSDGANMILTIGVYVDRNGKEYENGIEPDVKIASQEDLQPPLVERDKAINVAEEWIISDTEEIADLSDRPLRGRTRLVPHCGYWNLSYRECPFERSRPCGRRFA